MSTFPEKLRILLANREMTQAQLADHMILSTKAIQKWVSGKNMPKLKELLELCDFFQVSLQELVDDSIDIPKYIEIDRYLPFRMEMMPKERQDSIHVLYDAGLAKGAILHRFTNAGGDKCSAIYLHRQEVWWHYREHEARMIKDWNRENADD